MATAVHVDHLRLEHERAPAAASIFLMSLELVTFLFGICIGTLGTLVGVGGGFLIVPMITLIEPAWSTRTITAFSLAVVCANATSGSLRYLMQGRVDTRSAVSFALAAIPGVLLGVYGANTLHRGIFDRCFGLLLAAVSIWITFAPNARKRSTQGGTQRTLTDRDGKTYAWSFDMRVGLVGSAAIGVLSSLFGIGGGPIQVPFLITLLGYPEHVATATSHAVLAISSLVATIIHVIQGDYAQDSLLVICTAAGAVIGAPVGAALSKRIAGPVLLRVLALILAMIAIKLVLFAA